MARILIIDDDEAFRAAFAETLADLGHHPIEAASGAAGLDALVHHRPDAVFLDFRMAGMDGIAVLRRISEGKAGPAVPVVMLTAFASSTNTIEAMKLGAFEHLVKPVARRDIEQLLGRLLARPSLADQRSLEARDDRLVGNSAAMREVHKLIGRAAAGVSTVLITGETGTGKELVARLLHESSDRAARPFVAVNCAAIPRGLLESELFGHVKGAFTGAVSNRRGAFRQADGGTLLLDEIGDMGLDMQAAARVLEERMVTPVGANRPDPVDLRIVTATHHDVAGLVDEGRFRKDLYFRLNVLPIHIPPLRERPSDIAELAAYFLKEASVPESMGLSQAAMKRLQEYAWPGNVRELRNAMERAAALVSGEIVDAPDLAFLEAEDAKRSVADFDLTLLTGELSPAVEALERTMIRQALAACAGNRAEAARRLGIHRQLLYKKIEVYGLA